MQTDNDVSEAYRPQRLFARCYIALALGFPIGPYAISHLRNSLIIGVIAALLAATLVVGVLADGAIRHKFAGVLLAAFALCCVGAGLVIVFIMPFGSTKDTPTLGIARAAFLTPVVAGFTLAQTTGKDGQLFKSATLVGMFAWLGIAVHLVVYAMTFTSTDTASSSGVTSAHAAPASLNYTAIVLTGISLFFTVGFVYAAGAGLLGAAGRRALARLFGDR